MSERVKFAEERRASFDSGGFPWLQTKRISCVYEFVSGHEYLTRSAIVNGRIGLAAMSETSSSVMSTVEGGCDHRLISGGW
jgi:hypothetical protein